MSIRESGRRIFSLGYPHSGSREACGSINSLPSNSWHSHYIIFNFKAVFPFFFFFIYSFHSFFDSFFCFFFVSLPVLVCLFNQFWHYEWVEGEQRVGSAWVIYWSDTELSRVVLKGLSGQSGVVRVIPIERKGCVPLWTHEPIFNLFELC